MESFRKNRLRNFLSRLRFRRSMEECDRLSESFDFLTATTSPEMLDDCQMDFYPYAANLAKDISPLCSAPQQTREKLYETFLVSLLCPYLLLEF